MRYPTIPTPSGLLMVAWFAIWNLPALGGQVLLGPYPDPVTCTTQGHKFEVAYHAKEGVCRKYDITPDPATDPFPLRP